MICRHWKLMLKNLGEKGTILTKKMTSWEANLLQKTQWTIWTYTRHYSRWTQRSMVRLWVTSWWVKTTYQFGPIWSSWSVAKSRLTPITSRLWRQKSWRSDMKIRTLQLSWKKLRTYFICKETLKEITLSTMRVKRRDWISSWSPPPWKLKNWPDEQMRNKDRFMTFQGRWACSSPGAHPQTRDHRLNLTWTWLRHRVSFLLWLMNQTSVQMRTCWTLWFRMLSTTMMHSNRCLIRRKWLCIRRLWLHLQPLISIITILRPVRLLKDTNQYTILSFLSKTRSTISTFNTYKSSK